MGVQNFNGDVSYKVGFKVHNNTVFRWVHPYVLTVDDIGDPTFMTDGKNIVYADDIHPANLPSPFGNNYFVRKCSLCNLYYRDIQEHMRRVHGMNNYRIFASEAEYGSTPVRDRIRNLFSSTPNPIRKSRFFKE